MFYFMFVISTRIFKLLISIKDIRIIELIPILSDFYRVIDRLMNKLLKSNKVLVGCNNTLLNVVYTLGLV